MQFADFQHLLRWLPPENCGKSCDCTHLGFQCTCLRTESAPPPNEAMIPLRRRVSFLPTCAPGHRDKDTLFRCNADWLASLSMRCDKQHTHKSFKVQVTAAGLIFPTKEEAAYPWVLCVRMVSCIKTQLSNAGALDPKDMLSQLQAHEQNSSNRILLGGMPRGRKLRPFVIWSVFNGFGAGSRRGLFEALPAAEAQRQQDNTQTNLHMGAGTGLRSTISVHLCQQQRQVWWKKQLWEYREALKNLSKQRSQQAIQETLRFSYRRRQKHPS